MLVSKLRSLRAAGSEEGFTLIELMIVVVIIGILAAIAIPVFANQQKGAIVAGVQSDVKNTVTEIATALASDPTTSGITGSAKAAKGTGQTANGKTFNIYASDANTIVEVGGTWDGYAVVGINTGVNAKPTIKDGSTTLTITGSASTTATFSTTAIDGDLTISGTSKFAVAYSSATGDTQTYNK